MDDEDGDNPDAAPVVELRHEAGLTAGQTLPLRPGRFRFGPRRSDHGGLVSGTPDVVSFDLAIDAAGEAVLTAGAEVVAIEGVLIDRPATLDDGDVVQLTTDHFVLRSIESETEHPLLRPIEPRVVPPAELPSMAKWFAIFGIVTVIGCIAALSRGSLFGIALMGLGGVVATFAVRSYRHKQSRAANVTATTNARALFFSQIVAARKAAADALRADANTPAAVAARAGSTGRTESQHVTIASGDQAWSPPVVVHRSPGWNHQSIIDELSFLPAIPFTVDLGIGPLAIVGPRTATIAVARHIATTELASLGDEAGIDVVTDVPSDWRWLHQREPATTRILDHRSHPEGGDFDRGLDAPTIVLEASADDLARSFPGVDFQHVMTIADDGRASIRSSVGIDRSATGNGTGFVPHGITIQHAQDIQRLVLQADLVIDLRDADATSGEHSGPSSDVELSGFVDDPTASAAPVDRASTLQADVLDTSRLLVTGADRSKNKTLLATAALRQAAQHPDHALYVLDRGDRALIRLAQLDTCVRYVPIDQVDGVITLFDELDQLLADDHERGCILLAPDLWTTVDFYRSSGHRQLAERIDQVVSRMAEIPIAASSSGSHAAPHRSFLVWVETTSDDFAKLRAEDTNGLIELSSLPGIDLTGSIAKLASGFNKETPS